MHPDDAGEPAPPVALMSAADLGIEQAAAYLKGLADQPEELRLAARSMGIADAYAGRPPVIWIVNADLKAAYADGYQYETVRQKVVPRPPLVFDNRPRVVDPAVQATRDRLRRVTGG